MSRKRKPFCSGADSTSQGCHDRVQSRLLRKRRRPQEEAKERLRHAIDLDKDVRRLAIDDEDLKPLWDWIARLE